jgi:type II secretory ATPase GspE/PulE/Tfp pilus assembly ATPase PilB-like protein
MELMPVDDAVRNMIADKDTMVTIEQYNRSRGFRGLVDQATELLLTGEITLESARQFITRPLA